MTIRIFATFCPSFPIVCGAFHTATCWSQSTAALAFVAMVMFVAMFVDGDH